MFNSIIRRLGLILILAVSFAMAGCGGGSGGAVTGSVLSGLDNAKKLFNALRSNVISLGNKTETGFLQTEATAMSDDFNNLQKNGAFKFEQLLKALSRATNLVSEAAGGGGKLDLPLVSDPVAGSAYLRSWGDTPYDSSSPMTCLYFTTTGPGLPSATPARNSPGAGNALCWYFSDPLTQVVVKVSSSNAISSGGTYSYQNAAFIFASASCTNYFDPSCAVAVSPTLTGSFDATNNSNDWTSVTLVNGKLTPWVAGATDTTANLSWSLTSANGTDTLTVSGSVASTSATNSAKTISFSLLPNSKMTEVVATGAGTATLIAQVKTGAFQYDGTFSVTGNTGNGSIASSATSATFTGKVATVSGSTVTDFLDGTISATRDAATQNTDKATFSAKVLNGSAVSEISGAFDNTVSPHTLNFTYNFGGSYSLTAVGAKYDNGSSPNTLTITSSDGTRIVVTEVGLSATSQGSTSAKVYDSSGSPIGSIEPDSNQVNFVDGTYLLLL